MIPFSCAASSLGNLTSERPRLSSESAECDSISERRSVDQLQRQCVGAVRLLKSVNRSDIRVIQGREHLRFATERARRSGSNAKSSGRTFSAISRFSRIAIAVYLAIVPRRAGEDFVGTTERQR